MIDLGRTRAALLAEIAAPRPLGDPLRELTDPRLLNADARALVRGYTRDELFPLLKVVLSARFATVPPIELDRDLLVPLKSALGNAHKHGNRLDPAKSISVETVLTRKGALIAVTDEGEGFDVAAVVRDLQRRAPYFAHLGAGFRRLERASSVVAFDDGGRTLLLRFLPTAPATPRTSVAEPRELPELGLSPDRFESCRIYETPGEGRNDRSLRYVVRQRAADGRPETRILTGRLHSSARAAAADFDAATRLHHQLEMKRVWIPRPIARPASEPRLVLYEFDPWMDFGTYAAVRDDPEILRRRAARVGRALATLHRSRVALGKTEPELLGRSFRAQAARVRRQLESRHPERDLPARFRSVLRRIEAQAPLASGDLAPIHGRFGFRSVLYGVDGRFYFYRFEACRRSRPELDLGGFLADLLSWAALHGEEGSGIHDGARSAFLDGYFAARPDPIGREGLGLYVALALLDRLDRLEGALEHADLLLRLCERSLLGRG